jgi:SAM-dependent methyltransferase
MCERNFAQLARLLLADSDEPRVLVVGGRVLGQGIEHLLGQPDIELVETDVAFGPRTGLICDAHDIPFEDGTFDGVIAQGVLEHVVDPHRCVAEMHRVLGADGLVYAETAFMQQVHGGRFDFMRFTPLGHRRLLRAFSELDSGVLCGPAMALAWSYRYFLLSFARSRRARAVIDAFARATSSFLQYADRWLISRPGAFDAASAVYFMGRRSEQALTDRELITLYRGAQVGDTGPRPSAPRSGMRP